MCIIGYGGQNNKVLLKIFKLFRIIKKKNSLIFLKNFGGAKATLGYNDGPPLIYLDLISTWIWVLKAIPNFLFKDWLLYLYIDIWCEWWVPIKRVNFILDAVLVWLREQNISVQVDIGVPLFTHTHTHTHIYMFVFIYLCKNELIFMFISKKFKIHIFYKPKYINQYISLNNIFF